jgi:uncharacterized membrane protein
MTLYLAIFVLGLIAGLRTMTPLAAVSWAAALGVLNLAGTPLAFLGHPATPWVASALAAAELVADKLPMTPSRKVPLQFGARLLSGAFAGAAVGLPHASLIVGVVLGVIGAAFGTYGGAAGRGLLARAFGKDLPAALVEDLVAVAGAAVVVGVLL